MKIAISADSTCDLPKELIEKHNISIMPIIITLDEKEHQDGVDIDTTKLYEFIEKTGTLAKTAARSVYEYQEYFEKLLEGADHVIHFSLSFKLSATGSNAKKASEEISGNKVTVIDTESLSSGSGLLVLAGAEMAEEGKDVETIKSTIENMISKVQASFLVDTLKFLHKGGRCSSLALLGANLLKIKPRISLVDGEMKMTKKYMGNIDVSLIKYVNDMLVECPPNLDRAFVTCSSPMPVQEKIAGMLKEFGFKEVITARAGCTVCTHCGKNTLGILYIKQ